MGPTTNSYSSFGRVSGGSGRHSTVGVTGYIQWRNPLIKPSDPRRLAVDLLPRSICLVQCAAVIADKRGIFAWGWNSAGKGRGEHAEASAIRRANKKRLSGATIYVAAQWRDTKKHPSALPCLSCAQLLRGYGLDVCWRDRDGIWRTL